MIACRVPSRFARGGARYGPPRPGPALHLRGRAAWRDLLGLADDDHGAPVRRVEPSGHAAGVLEGDRLDEAVAAEQAAGRAAGGRPAGPEWDLLGLARWRGLPKRYGPYTTCYNRWRKAAVRNRIMDAILEAYDGAVEMIDGAVVRIHQHAANSKIRWRSLKVASPTARGRRPQRALEAVPCVVTR